MSTRKPAESEAQGKCTLTLMAGAAHYNVFYLLTYSIFHSHTLCYTVHIILMLGP